MTFIFNIFLSLVQILLDNYDGTLTMKSNILNNSYINIYKCLLTEDANCVLSYFNDYSILSTKKITIENIKAKRTIEEHTKSCISLLLLKNKRIASCSYDGTIRIFKLSDTYKNERVIRRKSSDISSICELDDGSIVSCSLDGSIAFDNFTIKEAHQYRIRKVLTLPNNRIVTFSEDVKIWKSNQPYSERPLKVIYRKYNAILYIKKYDIFLACNKTDLTFWSMSSYQIITVIKEVTCNAENAIYQIDNELVVIGALKKITIVNINKGTIEKVFQNNELDQIRCFMMMKDDKTIACGCNQGKICFYNMENQSHLIVKTEHSGGISDLLKIDDNVFLTASFDNSIKIWNY